MIAKIGHGTHLAGALYYNEDKVDQGNASILLLHKMQETVNKQYTVPQLMRSFEPYLAANKKTEKPALHISLNPDPKDVVSDEKFILMAQHYMEEMGYGDQPYIVFKHHDIERTHIHIVSTNVDRAGRKISDTYEKRRSMDACRKLEQQFDLHQATGNTDQGNKELFKPVDYRSGNIKSQIASVVRHLPRYYQFSTFGTYNALLSLFNITAEQVTAEKNGQTRRGLLYFAMDEKGEKASHPFKSSLFNKAAGLDALHKHFDFSKPQMADSDSRGILRSTVKVAMHSSKTEREFKQQLLDQGINTVVRRNPEGRVYGISFIDHESRMVWNGSQLGKDLSANVFNEIWKVDKDLSLNKKQNLPNTRFQQKASQEEIHPFFNFMSAENRPNLTDHSGFSLIGELLNQPSADGNEELAFEYEMKKKKKRPK